MGGQGQGYRGRDGKGRYGACLGGGGGQGEKDSVPGGRPECVGQVGFLGVVFSNLLQQVSQRYHLPFFPPVASLFMYTFFPFRVVLPLFYSQPFFF